MNSSQEGKSARLQGPYLQTCNIYEGPGKLPTIVIISMSVRTGQLDTPNTGVSWEALAGSAERVSTSLCLGDPSSPLQGAPTALSLHPHKAELRGSTPTTSGSFWGHTLCMIKLWPDARVDDFIPTGWQRSGTPMANRHYFVGGTLRE